MEDKDFYNAIFSLKKEGELHSAFVPQNIANRLLSEGLAVGVHDSIGNGYTLKVTERGKNFTIKNYIKTTMDLVNKDSSENNKCFIITPIGETNSETRKKADAIIRTIIKPILNELEIEPVVPHESNEPGSITSEIINEIIDDKLVIANLTGLNPNVMYELAIRHSFAKPVVCIFEKGTKLPFDIKDDRAIEYENSIAGVGDLQEKLKGMILAALKQTVINNPVTRAKKTLLITTKEEIHHIIDNYMDEHTMTDEDIDDLWTKEIKN